jgi:hypothetical protein
VEFFTGDWNFFLGHTGRLMPHHQQLFPKGQVLSTILLKDLRRKFSPNFLTNKKQCTTKTYYSCKTK